jgi:DNA (cytosine-5)-methyltransferase 1
VVLTWATRVQPRVIVVENVREFLGWGPLLQDGTPCPDRIGRSFTQWVGRLRGLGYRVQWRELCAADFGTPTIRTRLFVIARRDDAPIAWPQPTHSRTPSLLEQPWRSAAECIDWSLRCPSIFSRSSPLKDATLRRIAQGIVRYVLKAPDPFIIRTGHWSHRTDKGFQFRGQRLSDPLGTVTAINEKALIVPHVSALYGTSTGSDAAAPLGAVTAQGGHHALVAAHLTPITHVGDGRGSALHAPVPTLTCANRGEQALIAAFIAQHNGGSVGHDVRDPVSTLTVRATQQQIVAAQLNEADRAGTERVAAFLIQYYGSGGQGQDLRAPLGCITTRDRFALVTVNGVPRPLTDIGMRMLTPPELARAQGFDDDYDLSDNGRLTKTARVRLIGNSVCPPVAAAVVSANFRMAAGERTAA